MQFNYIYMLKYEIIMCFIQLCCRDNVAQTTHLHFRVSTTDIVTMLISQRTHALVERMSLETHVNMVMHRIDDLIQY